MTNPPPMTDDDGPCTTCDDTGITIQTERPCSCEVGDQYRANGDAPVTVEQCDRELYALIAPDMCALILDGELDQHRELQAIARHRLAALASAPAPSWSETPEHIRDHLALLAEVELHLKSSRVFVATREKMHPCGVELHDELLGKVTAAIETIGKGQVHG